MGFYIISILNGHDSKLFRPVAQSKSAAGLNIEPASQSFLNK